MIPPEHQTYTIRRCHQTEADLLTLQQISRETFRETFADSNSPENMSRYLSDNLSIEKLLTELSNKDSSFYLLEYDSNIIGYLKINVGSAQTENKYERSLEIERIYILSSFQGQGTGKILLEQALAVARTMKAEFVWLGVWEHNQRAIGFYRKHGFVEFDQHIFILGDDEQLDIMMKKYINA